MATCHWCHNMARESFEDEEIAGILNKHYISIKVDREERPDIDNAYMKVCQVMAGHGGWPLTVFLTPEKTPFFVGTYFPKERKLNMPGLKELLLKIAEAWPVEKSGLVRDGERIMEALRKGAGEGQGHRPGAGCALGEEMLGQAAKELLGQYDGKNGGFGEAPKFPIPSSIAFLLRWWERSGDGDALEAALHTLRSMAMGGIFDHLGYGFHRYSTDEKWLVPHFEKMLYDQALLSMVYLDAYQITGENAFADIVHKVFTYVLEKMQSPKGGFYTAENAETEGIEGKFYVWKKSEILEILGAEQGELISSYFGVTEKGNFGDGNNVLYLPVDEESFIGERKINSRQWSYFLEESRKRLFQGRTGRVNPSLDDKILTSWNGLMIGALARGGRVLGGDVYLQSASGAADFILTHLVKNGRLLHRYRDGETAFEGFLEDYAFFTAGLLDLYEAVFEPRFLAGAISLNKLMLELFLDDKHGGLFFSSKENAGELPLQDKEAYDGALPSGNSLAAMNMLRIAHFTGDGEMRELAQQLINYFSDSISWAPSSHAAMLSALDFSLGPVREMVLVGKAPGDSNVLALLRNIQKRFLPRKVFLFYNPGQETGRELAKISPLIKDKGLVDGKPAVYICENFSCQAPLTSPEDLEKYLQ
ncbi:MAG TPA: thioredoxin domain-containing protein [Firmicutes bacterium]|nr:thioredoxin domain-containing protein [Bacillota bacterium]